MSAGDGVRFDETKLEALERLLAIGEQLGDGRWLRTATKADFAALADTVVGSACELAGVTSAFTGRDGRRCESEPSRSVVVLELTQPTGKLWTCRAVLPREHCVALYEDGPSRQAAIANALVLGARLVIDQLAMGDGIPPEALLSCNLAEAMAQYEQALCPSPEEVANIEAERASRRHDTAPRSSEREPSFHGTGGVE